MMWRGISKEKFGDCDECVGGIRDAWLCDVMMRISAVTAAALA